VTRDPGLEAFYASARLGVRPVTVYPDEAGSRKFSGRSTFTTLGDYLHTPEV